MLSAGQSIQITLSQLAANIRFSEACDKQANAEAAYRIDKTKRNRFAVEAALQRHAEAMADRG